MEPAQRAELLKDEYIMLQQFYEDIDSKGLTIKSWAITVGLAAIGAGLTQQSRVIFIAGFVASLMFWYLEAYWRGLSHFFSRRILDIEQILRAQKLDEESPLQVYSTWEREYQKTGNQTFRYARKPLTAIPHALISVIMLALYILS